MELLFHRVYEVAEMVGLAVDVHGSFEELDWDSAIVSGCLLKFSKISLLGHFCFTHLRLHDSRMFRKDPECIDIEATHLAFHRHQIPYMPLNEFMRLNPMLGEHEEDHLHAWMLDQEAAFSLLWERMTNEVFRLLFGNRIFLLRFNVALGEFRKERGDASSPRCGIPQWVKKTVYFREAGRCALCRKDLSGLIAIDAKQHYDHIVPLKELGANDPSNIQLLCESCNLRKSARPARTSAIYEPWWS
jgi:hypothetical protein